MATALGTLLRLALAPSLAAVSFERLGFPAAAPAAAEQLEPVPRAVVVGFEAGIEARDLREIQWRLDLVAPTLRGFAYEGATMALTIADQLRSRRRARTPDLLRGPAAPHLFLTYIGIGFAMARLPRRRWSRVLPDLSGTAYYPALSWLAVDGYGFDLAYFDRRRWIDRQERPRPYPWLGAPDYFPRAVDQGIGRALWFIHAAAPEAVAAAVERFPATRQPDLWSGVGLAATFAGGADAVGLARLRELAGDQATELFQGAVFAAKARCFAGLVPPETELATKVLTGVDSRAAAALVDTAVAQARPSQPGHQYEHWRNNVRSRFAHVSTSL